MLPPGYRTCHHQHTSCIPTQPIETCTMFLNASKAFWGFQGTIKHYCTSSFLYVILVFLHSWGLRRFLEDMGKQCRALPAQRTVLENRKRWLHGGWRGQWCHSWHNSAILTRFTGMAPGAFALPPIPPPGLPLLLTWFFNYRISSFISSNCGNESTLL